MEYSKSMSPATISLSPADKPNERMLKDYNGAGRKQTSAWKIPQLVSILSGIPKRRQGDKATKERETLRVAPKLGQKLRSLNTISSNLFLQQASKIQTKTPFIPPTRIQLRSVVSIQLLSQLSDFHLRGSKIRSSWKVTLITVHLPIFNDSLFLNLSIFLMPRKDHIAHAIICSGLSSPNCETGDNSVRKRMLSLDVADFRYHTYATVNETLSKSIRRFCTLILHMSQLVS
jgi:hypothetical protein